MASTRQVPNLSAIAPNTGCPSPQARFWIAIARPNVVRSQPVSASIGNWKKPIAERGPKVISETRHPAAMTVHGKAGLPAGLMLDDISSIPKACFRRHPAGPPPTTHTAMDRSSLFDFFEGSIAEIDAAPTVRLADRFAKPLAIRKNAA